MSQKIVLPFAPRPAQKIIFDLLRRYRFVTAVCHRRLGKTRGAVAWLCLELLAHQDTALPFRGYYFAPTKEQARTVCWHFFKQMLEPLREAGKVTFHETTLSITGPNGGMIYLKSGEPDSVETARGIYIHRVVLDELASWRNSHVAFNEVIRPALMDTKGRAMFIGTVKGLDLLYEFFNRGADKRFKEWASVMFKASETGILSDEEIADYELENEHNPAAVDRELECNFFAESDDVLIPARLVQHAIGNPIMPSVYRNYAVKMGIDPGITSDPTCICIRQGPKVHAFIQLSESDHEILADKIIPIVRDWHPVRIFIDNGRGEQLIKQLVKKFRRFGTSRYEGLVQPVTFNAASLSASCFNFRTYMYWEARRWFAAGNKSVPDDKLFVQEVTNQLLEDTENTGSILRLAAKKKIRALLNRSPDRSDAFAVTFSNGLENAELIDEYRLTQLQAELREAGYAAKEEEYNPIEHLKRYKLG